MPGGSASPKLVPDLSRALLIDLDLRGINLAGAHLARTNLRQAILNRVNLSHANRARGSARSEPAPSQTRSGKFER